MGNPSSGDWNHLALRAGNRSIQAIEAGKGRLLVALHGFPDLPTTYRFQIPMLVSMGYHVVAPYMPGYHPLDRSPESAYETAAMTQDVLTIIDTIGAPAVVMGHDYGSVAAAGACIIEPSKIRKLISFAVPPGGSFGRALLTNPDQQRKSWYMFFFQLPMAQMAVAHNDLAFLERLWREWSPDWTLPRDHIDQVKEAFREPGMLEAALHYYRAVFNPSMQHPSLAQVRKRMAEPIPVPTLYIHGANDGCMGRELTDGMETSFPAGLRKHVIPSAGHFVHQERPDEVNALIRDFLAND